MNQAIKFVFFGGEPLAVPVLNQLKKAGLTPSLVVCNPDRPRGRGHVVTPPPVKLWAIAEGIEVFQPANYKDSLAEARLKSETWDLFVVVAYNFILPDWLLNIPKHQVINVHPSMLPSLRGASPIRTAILKNLPDEVGVTIMLMDKEMDHGPILEQEQLQIKPNQWPVSGADLDKILADKGGKLLAEVIPAWINDELLPQEQDHDMATYCSRFAKGENELVINPLQLPTGKVAKQIWHTVNAFIGIGDTYFIHDEKRIKITQANFTSGGTLEILKVIPEGKKEIDFKDYLQQLKK